MVLTAVRSLHDEETVGIAGDRTIERAFGWLFFLTSKDPPTESVRWSFVCGLWTSKPALISIVLSPRFPLKISLETKRPQQRQAKWSQRNFLNSFWTTLANRKMQ